MEENPKIFRQKTAPGLSSVLSDDQPSISSEVKPPATSDCFDSSRFRRHVLEISRARPASANQNKLLVLSVLPQATIDEDNLYLPTLPWGVVAGKEKPGDGATYYCLPRVVA